MTNRANRKTAPKTYYCLITYKSGKGVDIKELGLARNIEEAANLLQIKMEDINPHGGSTMMLTEQQVKDLATLVAANA